MAKDNAKDLGVVILLNQAHQQLPRRSQLMLAMLRQVETFSSRFVGESISQALLDTINNISELQDPVYGEIVLAVNNFIRDTKIEPFEDRIQELCDQLIDNIILNTLCEDDIINKLDDNIGTGFTKDWARNIMRIDETQCLKFHDTVLAEVVASSNRNVEKDVFIVRIIMGYR